MRKKPKSYVHFAFTGDFEPNEITNIIGLDPTAILRKGEIYSHSKFGLKYSSWELSSRIGKEELDMNNLVKEVISKLKGKEEIILAIKSKFDAHSLLQIKMDIDINDEVSTPFMGHDHKTIELLFKTKTETDIDIYIYIYIGMIQNDLNIKSPRAFNPNTITKIFAQSMQNPRAPGRSDMQSAG